MLKERVHKIQEQKNKITFTSLNVTRFPYTDLKIFTGYRVDAKKFYALSIKTSAARGGGYPVRTRGRFFRCGRPYFLVQKLLIYQNLWYVRTDKRGGG